MQSSGDAATVAATTAYNTFVYSCALIQEALVCLTDQQLIPVYFSTE